MKSLSFFNKNYKVHSNSSAAKELEAHVNEQKENLRESGILPSSIALE
jgi:hypothetical protein